MGSYSAIKMQHQRYWKKQPQSKREKNKYKKNKCNSKNKRVHKMQGMEQIENLKYCGKAKAKN